MPVKRCDMNIDISHLTLNTSNKNKLVEFKQFGLICDHTEKDLKEPLADPLTIIRYKATNVGENVIVEDSNFFIKNSDIGVDIKFKKDQILNFIGHEAEFVV